MDSVIELNRTHKNVPVRLCSFAEPIERLGSIMSFWFGSRIDYAGIIRDKVISYSRQQEEKMTAMNVQEYLFGK